jgi:hypothetical protein
LKEGRDRSSVQEWVIHLDGVFHVDKVSECPIADDNNRSERAIRRIVILTTLMIWLLRYPQKRHIDNFIIVVDALEDEANAVQASVDGEHEKRVHDADARCDFGNSHLLINSRKAWIHDEDMV